jgi:hypothetical protein
MSRPGTFNVGRNREKRAARTREAALRKDAVDRGFGGRAPKVKRSRLMINLLADRRLRQRQQVRS